ncbi:MAG: VanW family protein [bacterium]|nr:VanW family protein [bacterium]
MTRRPDLQMLATGAALAAILVFGAAGIARIVATQPQEVELAGYATRLTGRSGGQRHNARLAAQALTGVRIAPGATFSYNRTVRSWTVDRGYVKAPVSFDGELIRAFGGGVCQTSTTLYNAALLAGLPIVERHSHVFAPTYVAPGRDAAVAQHDIDLRFRNPYAWPVRIQARVVGDRLEVRLFGRQRLDPTIEVTSDVSSVTTPARLTLAPDQAGEPNGRTRQRSPGATGYRVLTYRIVSQDGQVVRRELLSDDTYQAANRVVTLMQAQAP